MSVFEHLVSIFGHSWTLQQLNHFDIRLIYSPLHRLAHPLALITMSRYTSLASYLIMSEYQSKISIRKFYKNKFFICTNIIGFSIGIVACLLILQYVFYKKCYDHLHLNGDRIHQGSTHEFALRCPNKYFPTFPAISSSIRQVFLELKQTVSLHSHLIHIRRLAEISSKTNKKTTTCC